MENQLFGTDGVRGLANAHPMTVELMMKLAKALGKKLSGSSKKGKVLIGRDPRKSGRMFENVISATLASYGVDVYLAGIIPTPAIAMLTPEYEMDYGIIITASHNPGHDNGIKIFNNQGYKLNEEEIQELETVLSTSEEEQIELPVRENIGDILDFEEGSIKYQSMVRSILKGKKFHELRVVLDCAHGAAYEIGPKVLFNIGVELSVQGVRPNGNNINDQVGALYPDVLKARVEQELADLGIALDGDGDRIIMVDENGETLDGDALIYILAKDMMENGFLKNNGVALTVMSNLGLRTSLEKLGISVAISDVGDPNLLKVMLEKGYNLGAEPSGHIIMLDYCSCGDGLLAALKVMEIMQNQRTPLSKFKKEIRLNPQILVNVEVREKPPLESLTSLMEVKKHVDEVLGEKGRSLIRYSGTENKLRIMLEHPNSALIEEQANALVSTTKELIGV